MIRHTLAQSLTRLPTLFRSSLLRDATLVLATNLISSVALFIGSIVLARIWDVGTFGVITALFGIASLVVGGTDLGILISTVRLVNQYRDTDAERYEFLLVCVLGIEIFLGVLIAAIAVWCAPLIAQQFLHAASGTDAVRWILFGAACLSATAYASALTQAHRLFSLYALLTLAGMGLRTVGMIVASYVWHSVEAVALSYFLATFLVMLVSFAVLLRRFPPARGLVYEGKRAAAGGFFQFGKWVAITATLNTLLMRVDVVMLSALANSVQVAIYGVAFQLSVGALIAINMFNTVLLPRASNIRTSAGMRHYIKQGVSLAALVAAGIVVVFVFAERLVTLLYGQAYLEAVPVLRIMLAGYFFYALSYPLSLLTYRLDRPDIFTKVNAAVLVARLAGDVWLIPVFGARGPAILLAVLTVLGQIGILVWLVLHGGRRAAQIGLEFQDATR